MLSIIPHFVLVRTRFEYRGGRGRRGKGGKGEDIEKHTLGLWSEKKGRKSGKDQSQFAGLEWE